MFQITVLTVGVRVYLTVVFVFIGVLAIEGQVLSLFLGVRLRVLGVVQVVIVGCGVAVLCAGTEESLALVLHEMEGFVFIWGRSEVVC